MSWKSNVVRALVVAVACPILLAQAAPDLKGTWKIDPSKTTAFPEGGSGGGGANGGQGGALGIGPPPDTLAIRQDAKTLTIVEHRGEMVTRMIYALDGTPSSNAVDAGRGAGGTSQAVSHWNNGKLETTVTMPPTRGTPGTAQYRQVRYLDSGGALVVEISWIGHPNMRRNVYTRVK